MNKLLIVIAIAAICSSCNKYRRECHAQPYYVLTPSVKQWFPYTGNKSLIFQDNTLKEDTLQLMDFFSGDDDVWNGDECGTTRGQFIRGAIIDVKSNDTIRTEMGYTDRIQIGRKRTWILFYDTKKAVSTPTAYRRFETAVTINGRTYTDVLVTACSPADSCIATGITSFYFAKGKGLAAFERNGISWTLKD